MAYEQAYYQDQRYGSAHWFTKAEIQQAGLLRPAGVQLGFLEQSPLYVDGDAPIITIGGAGSGKGRDVLIYSACTYRGTAFIHDPKGELAAVSLYHQHRLGIRGYCINPFNLHDLPQHKINPLDILKKDSLTLHADAKVIAENLISVSGSSNGQHFEILARSWLEAFLKFQVSENETTSLPDIYEIINMIEGQPQAFDTVATEMNMHNFPDVARIGGEIKFKRDHAPREFSGVVSTLYNAFAFMSEPAMRSCLSGGDFSLSTLCYKNPVKIYLMNPAEYLEVLAPFVRLVFTVAMLYKQRKPNAAKVLFMIDEAGQLGRFETLIKAFTYGRGGGIRAWAVFQDIGQIIRHYGREAITTFLGSAQTRQFIGVRDYDTANLLSNMLGSQTLSYDEPLQQSYASRAQMAAARTVLEGSDPIYAAYDFYQHSQNTSHQNKQARPLLTADEILNLPENRQILLISGKTDAPILAHKYPYYSRREMAGAYLSNPYHPPVNRVRIQGRFMSGIHRIKKGRPPFFKRKWPQFQKGFKYVRGFK